MQATARKNYFLFLLTVIVTFNFVDRLALGVVLQDMKTDLDLTDTQLGLLSGIAFALFYSVMGVPIARWADRGNRVTIIALTTALWSVAVAACGAAGSFIQLLSIRVAVAVGEAGCMPPALSLLADYFKRAERARAAAIYGMGGPLSFVFGFLFAGWLNELYGWRMTFVLLGLPGLLLAIVARFTLHEPRRDRHGSHDLRTHDLRTSLAQNVPHPTFKEVASTLWSNVTFRHLLLCLSVQGFFVYGILQWQPTYFVRSYGLETGQVGTWLAATYGAGGLIGNYLGGELASRFAANDERRQLRALAGIIAVAGVLSSIVYLSSNPYVAFALIGLFALGMTMLNGPLLATIQTLIPERMRATAIALVYLSANLIGMGLGPLATGALSDAFRPWAGEESLRYALLSLAPGYFWCAWHALRASKTVMHDLAAIQVDHAAAVTHLMTIEDRTDARAI
jgi:MFS transporter, Spinster family, sphingosine-1-phosphate transporter